MIRRIFCLLAKRALCVGHISLFFASAYSLLLAFFSPGQRAGCATALHPDLHRVKININAQRCRDSGGKARYIVIASILVYFASLVVAGLGYVGDDDCMLLGVRIYCAYDGPGVLFLDAGADPDKKTNKFYRQDIYLGEENEYYQQL